MKQKKTNSLKAWGAMAACFCILLIGIWTFANGTSGKPHPKQVQIPNPIMEVSSVEEMERCLDFKIPVLEKAVAQHIVLVIDQYPKIARIEYADSSTFHMEYGTGDISGIYGGVFLQEEEIQNVRVSFYQYTNQDNVTTPYALWEKDGFTYSLSGGASVDFEQLKAEVQSLIS